MLVDRQSALEERVDIARDHPDAVGIVPHQVGGHEILGHHLRFARLAAACGDDRFNGPGQVFFFEYRAHSGLIPPRCTTLVQRSTSSCMNLPNSSGVPATTSKP